MKADRKSATVVPSFKSRRGFVLAKDGGWGWVIVFAAFMVFVLSLGLLFSLGVMSTVFTTYFNENKSAIAWIFSIAIGVTDCVGPVVSGLTNRYGCRAVTISGALLASIGMLMSIPAPNVFYLYLTFGFTIGIGVGMMFLPSVIIVNSYFESKRALAIGISMCGSGVGTLLLSPVIEIILSSYGSWRSTVLLLAGIVLHAAIFGTLYRPPNIWIIPAEEYDDQGDEIVIFEPIPEVRESLFSAEPLEMTSAFPEQNGRLTESEPLLAKQFTRKPIKRSLSMSDLEDLDSAERRRSSALSLSFLRSLTNKGSVDITPSKTTRYDQWTASRAFQTPSERSRITVPTPSQRTGMSRASRVANVTSGLLYRKDIFYSGSLVTIPEYRNNDPEYYESIITTVVETPEEGEKWYSVPAEMLHALKEMMGLSLLRESAYQVVLISRFLASLGILVPYIYIVDTAASLEIENGSWLLSVISVGNMLGRLGMGYLSDRQNVNRILLYNLVLFSSGIAISAISICYSFLMLAVVSVVFGFTVGAFSSMIPVVLVDVLGIGKLTNAYGLTMCFQGIASIIGLPITAVIYDKTSSYVVGYLFSGALVLVSGLISCLAPVIIERRISSLKTSK